MTANKLHDFFRSVPLFSSLTAEELGDLLRAVRPADLKYDQALFRHGDPGDAAYVIEKGEVEIVSPGGDIIAILRDGAVFGELALLDGVPRSATVIARVDTRLFRIDKAEFDELRRTLRPAAYRLMRALARSLSGRIRSTNAQIAHLLDAQSADEVLVDATPEPERRGVLQRLFGWLG